MANGVLKRKNSNFELIGHYKKSERYPAFEIDKESESGYRFNTMNLLLDCGEKHGRIASQLIGGYNPKNDRNVLYVHGKDANNRADYNNQFQVMWDDRFDDRILEDVANDCFMRVRIEKDTKNNYVVKRFLSEYDLIEYLNENLPNECDLSIRGNIKYDLYNGATTRKLVPTYIGIYESRNEEPVKYKAEFTQTILIDKNSVSKNVKEYFDKDKGTILVDGYVVDYIYKLNGNLIKKNIALPYHFEFLCPNPDNSALVKKMRDFCFGVKKGVSEITYKGEFIESGATVQATEDDLTDDIKTLIECGMFSKEEALAMCATGGNRERRMVLTKANIRYRENEDGREMIPYRIDEVYEEDDLIYEMPEEENSEPKKMKTVEVDNSTNDDLLEKSDYTDDDLAALFEMIG